MLKVYFLFILNIFFIFKNSNFKKSESEKDPVGYSACFFTSSDQCKRDTRISEICKDSPGNDEDIDILVKNYLNQIDTFFTSILRKSISKDTLPYPIPDFIYQNCPEVCYAIAYKAPRSISSIKSENLDFVNLEVPSVNLQETLEADYISFNYDYFKTIEDEEQRNWAIFSVLSHEIGHHFLSHLEIKLERNHEKRWIELAADAFSGYMLSKWNPNPPNKDYIFIGLNELNKSSEYRPRDRYEENRYTHPILGKRRKSLEFGFEKGKKDEVDLKMFKYMHNGFISATLDIIMKDPDIYKSRLNTYKLMMSEDFGGEGAYDEVDVQKLKSILLFDVHGFDESDFGIY